MFFQNYLRLCNSKNIKPTAAALEMGIAKATVSRWKSGCKPNSATLQKIADYFGVPVETLTAGQKEKAPGRMAEDLSAEELEIVSILRKMSPEQLARELAYLRQAAADGQDK
jgi:transcriptional regulator with XRE-family HTH domain